MKKLLILYFVFLLSNTAHSQFGPQHIIDSGVFGITHIITADLSNNGYQDIITSQKYWQNDKISYFINDGNGQFGPQQIISTNVLSPNAVAAGDLNNDGWTDIVAISTNGSASVLWYPNVSGSFPTEIILDSNLIFPEGVIVADMNNDGFYDIVVLDHIQIILYTNDGSGHFTKSTTPNDSFEYYTFYIADIDGDGYQDIIAGSGQVLVYINNNGIFEFDTARTNSIVNPGLVFLVYLNDLNNDGTPDLVIDGNSNNEIRWYANDGNGFFSYSQTIHTTAQCKSVIAKDFDGDGDNDLLAALFQEGEIVWFENPGAGNFGPKQIAGTGPIAHTTEVYAADLNNDSLYDIIWAHHLSFQLNQITSGVHVLETLNFRLFPNPCSEVLHLYSRTGGIIRIFDVNGRNVFNNYEITEDENILKIHLSPGVYILELESEGKRRNEKFIVQSSHMISQ